MLVWDCHFLERRQEQPVYFMKKQMNLLLQKALSGFAAGVMVAASIWSLLIPAMEQSEAMGKLAFLPAAIGFWLGIIFLLLIDTLMPHLHIDSKEAEGSRAISNVRL